MFDNHIQNICVAQMERGEEKKKEVGRGTRVEKRGERR